MSDPGSQPESGTNQQEYLFCPYCTGGNLLDATRCRWCRRPLGPDAEPPTQAEEVITVPPVPLEQIFCPHCKGGNPPASVRCMWCKRPLDLDAAAAELPPPRNLLDSYKRATIAPSLLRYASEVPSASWRRIWISLAIAAAVSSVVTTIQEVLSGSDLTEIVAGALGAAIGVPVAFFLTALPLYGVAKLFGGKGRTGRFKPDFLVHAYLVVLPFVPFSIVTDVLLTIPEVGTCIWLIPGLYQLYLSYLIVQVSRQLDPSSAVGTVIALIIVEVLLILCVIGIVVGVYLSQQLDWTLGSGLNP